MLRYSQESGRQEDLWPSNAASTESADPENNDLSLQTQVGERGIANISLRPPAFQVNFGMYSNHKKSLDNMANISEHNPLAHCWNDVVVCVYIYI